MMQREAQAVLQGSPHCPRVCGLVRFTDKDCGCVVQVKVNNLPSDGGRPPRFHGFHIHECGDCTPSRGCDSFPRAGLPFNPTCQPPGRRAGDMPPLLSSCGEAMATFYTGAFCVQDILNRSVAVHMDSNSSCNNPSGSAGQMIACGVICPLNSCECAPPTRPRCEPLCPPKPLWPRRGW